MKSAITRVPEQSSTGSGSEVHRHALEKGSSMKKSTSQRKRLLLRLLDEAYNKKAWHGTNLRGALRNLTPHEALWRPGRKRNSIWEIMLHTAYWKYTVRRRLLGEKRGSFPLKGSNWFRSRKKGDHRLWKNDLALLDEIHRTMRSAVASLSESGLSKTTHDSKHKNEDLIIGVAAHDLYHAGQIQVLKKLIKKSGR